MTIFNAISSAYSTAKNKVVDAANTVVNTLFPESPAREAGREAWETLKALGRTGKSVLKSIWTLARTLVASCKMGVNTAVGNYYAADARNAEDIQQAVESAATAVSYLAQSQQDSDWAYQEAKETLQNVGESVINAGSTVLHIAETTYYGAVNPMLYGAAYLATGAANGIYGLAESAIGEMVAPDLVAAVEEAAEAPVLQQPAQVQPAQQARLEFLPGFKAGVQRLADDAEEIQMGEIPVDALRAAAPAA